MTQAKLTTLETQVATLFAEHSEWSCGCFEDGQNLSYMNAADLAEETGYGLQKVGGIMSSLLAKGLITDMQESVRGADINDFIGDPEEYLKYEELKGLVTQFCD